MAWFKRVHRPNAPVCGLSKNKTPSATAPQYHRTCIMQVYSLPRIIRTGFDYDTIGIDSSVPRSCNGEFVFQSGCHRSLQNQPRRVESKPATPKCLIHIKFLDPSKRHFNFFKSAAHQPMSCAAKMLPLLPCDIRQTPRGLHASTAVVSGAICRDTSSQFRRSQPPPTG